MAPKLHVSAPRSEDVAVVSSCVEASVAPHGSELGAKIYGAELGAVCVGAELGAKCLCSVQFFTMLVAELEFATKIKFVAHVVIYNFD